MYKIKILLIFLGIALMITMSTFFIKGRVAVFGEVPMNTIVGGFPFHFYERTYTDYHLYEPPISHKFLTGLFLGDILIYFLAIICFWYLFTLGRKFKKWRPLFLAGIIGFIFLLLSVVTSEYCGAGFPAEFYPNCEMEINNRILNYIITGFLIDILFWVGLSVILVAILYRISLSNWFRNFISYKDVWLTIISSWIILTVISFIGMIGDAKDESSLGILLSVISIPLLVKARQYYKSKGAKGKGKKFFLSKVGYIVFGISLGMVALSTVFNISYQGGWFDFTDLGFILLSYPLNIFIKFQFDSDIFSKRIILYLISFANLAMMIFIIDIIGAGFIWIYRTMTKIIVINNKSYK